MRFTTSAMVVIAALGAACNKKEPSAGDHGAGSGNANAIAGSAGSAAVGSAAVAPPAGPWTVPATARAAKGDVDATALGPAVTAHFVERVQTGTQGGGRIVKTVLVLEGAGAAIAADETEEEFAQDGAPATLAIAGTKDLVLAPLSPPRPFADADADVPLDFKGPLLYFVHFQSAGEKRAVAIARDKDAIVVSSLVAPSDAVDVAPAWSTTGTIKLAPGATVTAADTTAAADPPSAAARTAPAAGGHLAATALDDALGAKGVQRDDVVKRADQPGSQWAVVAVKPATAGANPNAYTVWRVTAAGPSTLALSVPPAPPNAAWFEDATAIDVKDLDHDGIDDAVITVKWVRQLDQTAKHHTLTTTEHVEQVYVIGGAQLAIGATHASSYHTETNLGPDENPQPEETVAVTYAVDAGPPPVLHAKVASSSLQPKRIKGLLGAADPLLAAGDLPIAFH